MILLPKENSTASALVNAANAGITFLPTVSEKNPEKKEQESSTKPIFDYPSWGQAEHTAVDFKAIQPLPKDQLGKAVNLLRRHTDLSGFKLEGAGLVEHYQ